VESAIQSAGLPRKVGGRHGLYLSVCCQDVPASYTTPEVVCRKGWMEAGVCLAHSYIHVTYSAPQVVLNLSPRVDLDGSEVRRSALLPAVLVAPLDDKLSTSQIAASG
jgi:hypothetical protein